MASSVVEHPENVYVPMGECRGCRQRLMCDGLPDDLRIKAHNTQDSEMRKKCEALAVRAGRRYVDYPPCFGSKKPPVPDSVSWPTVWYPRATLA